MNAFMKVANVAVLGLCVSHGFAGEDEPKKSLRVRKDASPTSESSVEKDAISIAPLGDSSNTPSSSDPKSLERSVAPSVGFALRDIPEDQGPQPANYAPQGPAFSNPFSQGAMSAHPNNQHSAVVNPVPLQENARTTAIRTDPNLERKSPPTRALISLGPVRIIRGENSQAGIDRVAGRPYSATHPYLAGNGWKKIAPNVGVGDREAMQKPSLKGKAIAPDDESFQRPRLPVANAPTAARSPSPEGSQPIFRQQSPSPGFSSPVMPNNPNLGQGSVLPNQMQPGLQNQPNLAPGMNGLGSSGITGNVLPRDIPSATNPNNLPRYQSPRVVTGQPFVSPPPCQFDAYDMVHPANYTNAYPVCGGPAIVPGAPPPYASPYAYVPPTITPDMAPGMYSPDNSGWRPLLTLGQENYNAQIGRGILGQPTAYVPGQPFRNFLRYIFP